MWYEGAIREGGSVSRCKEGRKEDIDCGIDQEETMLKKDDANQNDNDNQEDKVHPKLILTYDIYLSSQIEGPT